jgi:hypothetical protein
MWGEVTQIKYTHMNKCKTNKKNFFKVGEGQCVVPKAKA